MAESANQAPSMPLSVKIEKKLACLPKPSSKPCFFKVRNSLRMENEKAYEPEILSIGPYHHGKENVKAMEEQKLRYLKSLLKRKERTSVQKQVLLQKMVDAMRDSEKKARECYDSLSTLENDDEFVEMMLLDGCFIIELFCRYKERTSEDEHDPESGEEHHDPESGEEHHDPESGEEHHDPESGEEYDPELGYMYDPPSGEEDDPIFDLVQPRGSIRRDLLLYENQLPFFILVRLVELIEPSLKLSEMAVCFFSKMQFFSEMHPPLSQKKPRKMTKPSDSPNITDMVLRLFRELLKIVRSVLESSTTTSARSNPEVLESLISPSPEVLESSAIMPEGTEDSETDDDDNETHLLSLIHDSWFSTSSKSESPGNESESPERESAGNESESPGNEGESPGNEGESPGNERKSPEKRGLEFIKCTTELAETGIKFKPAEKNTPLLNIKFNIRNGVMKIPPLTIIDTTECHFRNLIAYEQYRWVTHSKCVTDYCIFMDRLINSANDAQELRHLGIINNWLGDDEVVSEMFNNLGNNVYLSEKFCYSQVFNDVNKYCGKTLNKWRASLVQKYFNSPWAILSLFAAIFLLLLAVIQTIFAILSYV